MSTHGETRTAVRYVFEGGFPTAETVERAYDDADLNRAIGAYRFFYPTVSRLAIFKGPGRGGCDSVRWSRRCRPTRRA